MVKVSSLALIFVALLTLSSNADNKIGYGEIQNSDELSQKTIQGWQSHLDEVKKIGVIQKGCEPFFRSAKGKAKGNVMLFHGFTACPQQYIELSSKLSDMGYNTFVPLIIGHGKPPINENNEIKDQSDDLPDSSSSSAYREFAKNIAGIIKEESGTKVIGGISTGAIMAASAMIDNTELYDRGFMISPFFTVTPGTYGFLFNTLGKIIPEYRLSWGKECEDSRKIERSGYCNFKIDKLSSVEKFGKDTFKELQKIDKKMQILGVEKDFSASTFEMVKAAKKIPNSNQCFFPEGAVHSLISRYDDPQIEKYWINPLLDQLTRYIDTGKRFDTVANYQNDLKLCHYR